MQRFSRPKSCIIMLKAMETNVERTIADSGLLNMNDWVLVALSGGPDSVVLLHLLTQLRWSQKLTLFAVYINHGLRPRAAAREEDFCSRFCDRLDVPLTIVRENIRRRAREERKSVEEAGRDFRYATFERLAKELHCTRIALGHHADDRVETILFHLLRGTGRSGLIGMPVKRGKIIRPLFGLTKSDILDYVKRHRLKYCSDLSNIDAKYTRNFLRNTLLPLVEKRLNPNVRAALLNLSDTLEPEEAYLESLVAKAENRLSKRTPGGKIVLATERYRSYPVWFRRRLLRRCLKAICPNGQPPDRAVTDRLDGLIMDYGRAMSLPGGIQAALIDRCLYLWCPHKPTYEIELPVGKPVDLGWPSLRFGATVARGTKVGGRRKSSVVWLDRSRVRGDLKVRNGRPGERFRPLGAPGTKKLAEFLIDRKVPAPLRDETPVVCDRDGIIWVVGIEIAERVKRDTSTRKVLKVAVNQRKTTAPETV